MPQIEPVLVEAIALPTNMSYVVEQVRFITDTTVMYLYVKLSGAFDDTDGVKGWYRQTYDSDVTMADALTEALDGNAYLDWDRVNPPATI